MADVRVSPQSQGYVWNGSVWTEQTGDAANGTDVDVTRVQGTVTVGGTVTADTELPAGASLGDSLSNPTTPLIGSAGVLWDGTQWERQRSIDALGGASAASTVGIAATGIGPGFDVKYDPADLATALNSVIEHSVNGAGMFIYHVGDTTTGTFIFEISANGVDWVQSSNRLCVWQLGLNATVISGNITPSAGDVFAVDTRGMRGVRVRTSATLGAAVTFRVNAHVNPISMYINGQAPNDAAIDSGTPGGIYPVLVGGRAYDGTPAEVNSDGDGVWMWLTRTGAQVTANLPHVGLAADSRTLTTKSAQYTTTQTGTALWTPTSGKKLCIIAYQIDASGTTAGDVQLWFESSNGDTTYTRGTDLAIFDGGFKPSSTLRPGVVQSGVWIASAADMDLRVTDSAAINPLNVTVWGYEI